MNKTYSPNIFRPRTNDRDNRSRKENAGNRKEGEDDHPTTSIPINRRHIRGPRHLRPHSRQERARYNSQARSRPASITPVSISELSHPKLALPRRFRACESSNQIGSCATIALERTPSCPSALPRLEYLPRSLLGHFCAGPGARENRFPHSLHFGATDTSDTLSHSLDQHVYFLS